MNRKNLLTSVIIALCNCWLLVSGVAQGAYIGAKLHLIAVGASLGSSSVYAVTEDGTLVKFADSGEVEKTLPLVFHRDEKRTLAASFSQNGKYLAILFNQHGDRGVSAPKGHLTAKIIDTRTFQIVHEMFIPHPKFGGISRVGVDNFGRFGFYGVEFDRCSAPTKLIDFVEKKVIYQSEGNPNLSDIYPDGSLYPEGPTFAFRPKGSPYGMLESMVFGLYEFLGQKD